MEPRPPRVARDTRLLLIIVLVSISTLWVLARIRFPDRVTPNPVPPVLAQLAPRSGFEGLADVVNQLQPQLEPVIARVEVQRSEEGSEAVHRTILALRIRSDLAVALMDDHESIVGQTDGGPALIARDPASRLAAIAVPDGAWVSSTWSPRQLQSSRFFMTAAVAREGLWIRPVFVGPLAETASPLWSAPIWSGESTADLAPPGTFLFTVDGGLAGVVVTGNGQNAIAPGDVVISMAEQLAREGQKPAGWIGVDVQALTSDAAKALGGTAGALVTWVDPRSPAAGLLQATDIVEEANGMRMLTLEHWRAAIARLAQGQSVAMKIRRHGELSEVSLAASGIPAPAADQPFGLTLKTVPNVGAEVVGIAPASTAASSGLQIGDLLTRAGDTEAPTATRVMRMLASASHDHPLIVAVTRQRLHRIVVLRNHR